MLRNQLFGVVALAATMGQVSTLQAQEPQHPIPVVSDVTMKQAAYSSNVEITYKLSGASAIVTLAIETNSVAIPDSAVTRLVGDVSVVVAPGEDTKSITWNAGADWPENITETAVARVTAWSLTNPPEVMVVDLRKGTEASAENQYPVNYYPSTDALLDGLGNPIYKSDYLVLKKIKKGSFVMGVAPTTVSVTLTNDFYIGVYEVTQSQWANIDGADRDASFTEVTSKPFRPMETVSYEDIRGVMGSGYNWPSTGSAVSETSLMGKLRTRTGNRILFDLPTEAQWEYACRAGTTTYYSDGIPGTPNTTSNGQLDVLGRYSRNGGEVWNGTKWDTAPYTSGSDFGTAIVGSYLPNAWGLYDVHGNVYEWCLDWFGSTLSGGFEPEGPSSGTTDRVMRGGSWNSPPDASQSAYRRGYSRTQRNRGVGLRMAAAPVVSVE